MRRECAFTTSCRRAVRDGTTPGPLRSPAAARENRRVSLREHTAATTSSKHASASSRAASRRRDSWSRVPRARRSRPPTAPSTSTSPAGSPARTRATGSRPSSPRSTSRSTASSTSASWSAPTSPTSRSAGGSPSTRPARARRRSRSSSTPAPRRSRTRSRSRAPPPAGPAVVVFENGFHGRTLLTMAMTSKVRPYKAGFGPFPGEVYRAAAPYPVPRHRHGRRDRVARAPVQERGRGRDGRVRRARDRCRARAASSRCRGDYLARLRELCDRARDPLRRRRGAVGRGADRADVGDRALAASRPTCSSRASRSAAGCRSPRSPGGAEVMDAPGPGGLGGTFGGNPVACAAAAVVLDTVAEPDVPRPRGRARRDAAGAARGARRAARRDRRGARARADAGARARASRAPTSPSEVTAAAFERGLLLLSCGLYGNVLRLLPPLTVTDEELERGLELLEESLAAAG